MDKVFPHLIKNMSTFIHNASSKHTATVIFLHGLGDNGCNWCESFKEISASHIKYICPTAPSIPVTLNCGMCMPAWFDIYSLSPGGKEDEKGINTAADLVQKYIAGEEALGIPRSRIVIGGFSQGGATALYSSLSRPHTPLAGVLALSSWLPMHKSFPAALKANQSTPMLQCHGSADQMVPYILGSMTSELIKQFNNHLEFKVFNGLGHTSSDQEMTEVKTFLQKCLPAV